MRGSTVCRFISVDIKAWFSGTSYIGLRRTVFAVDLEADENAVFSLGS